MSIRVRRLLFAATLTVLFSAALHLDAQAKSVTIAVLPCSDVEGAFSQFQPLAKYLREETGLEIELIFPRDARQLENFILKSQADFVFQEPGAYVRLRNTFSAATALQVLDIEGKDVNSGAVVVRKDSGLRTLADLRGKVVEFGAPGSTTKWLAAKWLFIKNGIDPDADLRYYYHGGCCEDIAFTVFFKVADAGIVCAHAMDKLFKAKSIDPGELMVIAQTEEVPTWVFAATKGVDAATASAVNQALLKLAPSNEKHRAILNQAELGGFVRVDEARMDAFGRKVP